MYISIWDVYKNIKKATCDYTKELSALSRQPLFSFYAMLLVKYGIKSI